MTKKARNQRTSTRLPYHLPKTKKTENFKPRRLSFRGDALSCARVRFLVWRAAGDLRGRADRRWSEKAAWDAADPGPMVAQNSQSDGRSTEPNRYRRSAPLRGVARRFERAPRAIAGQPQHAVRSACGAA